MKRRIASLVTALALCLSLCPAGASAAGAVTDETDGTGNQTESSTARLRGDVVTYLDADGAAQTLNETYTTVTDSDTAVTWTDGWYVVEDNAGNEVYLHERVTVDGDVHLLLENGCSIKVRTGITVSEGNSLTIYAQSADPDTMGSLSTATASTQSAGIGGRGNSGAAGTITINGGKINAKGGVNGGAGIGGGATGSNQRGLSGGTITINGGIVTATGNSGAGIGGGGSTKAADANITINGGTVTAIGSDGAAGIGGNGGSVTINGGTVTATGGDGAAGIGGNGGTVTITGGTVTATGTVGGAGIGSNFNLDDEESGTVTVTTINISGGDITATGADGANAIGNGASSSGSTVTIDGGTVTTGGDISTTLPTDATIVSGSVNGQFYADSQPVNPVAEVTCDGTTTYVTDLAEAFQRSGNRVDVKLLRDVALAEPISPVLGSTVYLYLNNYTITRTEPSSPNAFVLRGDSVLNIYGGSSGSDTTGTGKIVSQFDSAIKITYSAATLKLWSGTVQTNVLSNAAISVTSGTVEVYEGAHVTARTNAQQGGALSVSGSGKAKLYGGTFTGGVSRKGSAALTLYGGTFELSNDPNALDSTCVWSGTDATLGDLLGTLDGEHRAYYDADGALIKGKLSEQALTVPVTVKPCTHEGEEVRDLGNGTHGSSHGACTACGTALIGDHTWHDGADGGKSCTVCGAKAVAEVTIGSSTSYVTDLREVLQTTRENAAVKLLSNVTLTERIDPAKDYDLAVEFSLDLNGHTITKTGNIEPVFDLNHRVTLEILDSSGSGKIIAENGDGIHIPMSSSAHLSVRGGTIQAAGDRLHMAISMQGGSADIYDGTLIAPAYSLRVQGGSATVRGGTFIGCAGKSSGTLTLLGGTFTNTNETSASVMAYNSQIGSLLGSIGDLKCAYYDADGNLIKGKLNDQQLTGTVTVKPCSHEGEVHDLSDGTHGGTCTACGTELTAEAHTWSGDGTCTVCGADAVAEVTVTTGSVTDAPFYVTNLAEAFTATSGNTRVKLLRDVTLTEEITLNNTTSFFIVDLNGHTITQDGSAPVFDLSSGHLYIVSSQAGENKGSILAQHNSAINMIGGSLNVRNITVQTNSNDPAIHMSGGNIDIREDPVITTKSSTSGAFRVAGDEGSVGDVTINGGTFNGGLNLSGSVEGLNLDDGTFVPVGGGMSIHLDDSLTLGDLLNNKGSYRAYYGIENNLPVKGILGEHDLSVAVTVRSCDHEDAEIASNGNGTHSVNCTACGYRQDDADCNFGYQYTSDDNTHTRTCTVCGYHETEPHQWYIYTEDGKTNVLRCETCWYRQTVTVTLTLPEPLYFRETKGVAPQYATSPERVLENVKWMLYELVEGSRQQIDMEEGDVLPALDVGRYFLDFYNYDGTLGDNNALKGSLEFFVNHAPLTADMVTLSQAQYTYDGTAKTPAVTVTRNGTVLAKDTDYTVAYSENINAGTAKAVVTGIGNYTGEAERTFEIAKATPIINVVPTATVSYGQMLSAAVLSSGEVNVPGSWSWKEPNNRLESSGAAPAVFTPKDTANYTTAERDIDVTVHPATPEITLTVPSYQIVGGTVAVTWSAANPYDAAFKAGLPTTATMTYRIGDGSEQAFDGSFTIPETAAVGTAITVTVRTSAVEDKYTVGEQTATVEVTDKTPVTISGVTVAERVFDGTPIAYTGTPVMTTEDGTKVDAPVTFTWSSGEAPVNAGDYTLTMEADSDKYIGSATVAFTIRKATVTVKADDKRVDVGGTLPALTYTVTGLAAGDTLPSEPTLHCAADLNVKGEYPITVSGAAVPDSGNYEETIAYETGVLSVTDPAVHVTGVELNKRSLSLTVGGTEQLTATVAPEDATDKSVTWKSSNAAVATVSADGTVTAVSAGTAEITVTTADGGLTAVCTVTVRASGGSSGGSGGGGSSAPSVTVPVSGEKDTVHVSASVTGSTATVNRIDTTHIEQVIGADGQAGMVEIDFTNLAQSVDTVTLPTSAVKAIAEQAEKVGGLTVKLPGGAVSFDTAALTAIQAQAGGGQVTLTVTPAQAGDLNRRQQDAVGDAPVFDLTLKSGSGAITDFRGGYATVALPYTLSAGENPSGVVVYYLDSSGNVSPCTTMYDVRSKSAIFTTGHLSLYFVGYDPAAAWVNPFSDVAEDAWYYDAVQYACENSLMSGYGDGRFGPDDALTRAQFAQILFNKEGNPVVNYLLRYDDVATGAWYTEAVRWASSRGIVNGYGDGLFGPDDPITREQLTVMLWRYAGSPAAGETDLPFPNAGEAGDYALAALRWAVEEGIVSGGGDGRLDPKGSATRAQAAQMLMRFWKNG